MEGGELMEPYIDQGQETLDWAVKNNQVFLIMFIVIFVVLLFVLYTAYKLLIKERAETKSEHKIFLATLDKQQDLISAQQKLLEDEKRLFEDMNHTVKDINNKMDLVLHVRKD